MMLTTEESRVLGALVEKELTTPDQYPLTLKAVLAASNQASNRDPVVDYDEGTVMATLDSLKGKRVIRFVLPSHGRTAVRYRHILGEALGLDTSQCALLAVLLLRGPQTVGELRARTERMAEFDSLEEIDHQLRFLSATAEPLAVSLGRRPGQKEERWACPLVLPASPTVEVVPQSRRADTQADSAEPDHTGGVRGTGGDTGAGDPLGEVRAEIASLRAEVGQLRHELDSLRTSLGG
jgi:uncharacterized protein YceH (UPF0502 family)